MQYGSSCDNICQKMVVIRRITATRASAAAMRRSLLGSAPRIGANSIVAGHCIVSEGQQFDDNAVIAGVPGKQIATRDNSSHTKFNANFYRAVRSS